MKVKRIIALFLSALCLFGLASCTRLSGLSGNENYMEGIPKS